jgi:Protein of unknown function (DUF1553)/Protein of unknown function (DUF1549)
VVCGGRLGHFVRWRGDVSAGQTVEIQFAQSVGQTFLGINLKCASCHDSFIDRWKLEESFGLAAIYATRPLEIHRCDKPIGTIATASWLFPELGQIDPQTPQPERLKQLAARMTHPENGRFARTIVNRLWQRLMGRGIVHPTDAMQTEPWNADLLDYLAVHLADHRYDLKQTTAPERPFMAIENPISVTDLHATVYTAMGISPKSVFPQDGSLLRPGLDGDRPDRDNQGQARLGGSFNFGGILDSVELIVAPQVRMDDLFVRADPTTGKVRWKPDPDV